MMATVGSSEVSLRSTASPLPERGWNVRRRPTKGKGLPALGRPDPSGTVLTANAAYWISRTLSQRKSTSSALSQRKVAIGPPQVIGIPAALAPHELASPPKDPSSV